MTNADETPVLVLPPTDVPALQGLDRVDDRTCRGAVVCGLLVGAQDGRWP